MFKIIYSMPEKEELINIPEEICTAVKDAVQIFNDNYENNEGGFVMIAEDNDDLEQALLLLKLEHNTDAGEYEYIDEILDWYKLTYLCGTEFGVVLFTLKDSFNHLRRGVMANVVNS